MRVGGVVLVDDDVEHLLRADGGEGDDRVAVLDRQASEADALFPHQLVLLAASLVDLTRAAGEHEHRCPFIHERPDVLAGAAHHAAGREQLAPDRDRVMGVLAERAHRERAPPPYLREHEGKVEERVEGVVSREQRPVGGDVLHAVEPRLGDPLQRSQDRCQVIELSSAGQRGISGGALWCLAIASALR